MAGCTTEFHKQIYKVRQANFLLIPLAQYEKKITKFLKFPLQFCFT
jgi:hypothetical protein